MCSPTIAFLRGRGAGTMTGVEDGTGAGVGLRVWAGVGARLGPFPARLQYSSSWLPTLLGDTTPHFPWPPTPPLLVRRYDVVFSELEKDEEGRQQSDEKLLCGFTVIDCCL